MTSTFHQPKFKLNVIMISDLLLKIIQTHMFITVPISPSLKHIYMKNGQPIVALLVESYVDSLFSSKMAMSL